MSLPSEIAAWAAPQERFEELRKKTLLHSGSGLCDLAYANAYDGPSDAVRRALQSAISEVRSLDLQYTPYGGSPIPRRLIAQSLSRSHDAPFQWQQIVLTPGAMAALNVLLRSLAPDPGDEVVVLTPCWLDYPLYLANLGIRPRLVPLSPKTFSLDLGAIAGAVNARTRALILSQPCNPTGRLYPVEELRELAEILHSVGVRPMLISDECHRDVSFQSDFVSPSTFYQRTCIVYSFGKGLFMQGQRIGYVAVSPNMQGADAYARELEQWCRVMGFCTPTALMQRALPALMKIRPDWSGVERKRQYVLDAFAARGLEIVPSQGGIFLYCAAGDSDEMPRLEMLADRGVLVLPSSVFHHGGYFRVALTASDEALQRALPHLLDVVSGEDESRARRV